MPPAASPPLADLYPGIFFQSRKASNSSLIISLCSTLILSDIVICAKLQKASITQASTRRPLETIRPERHQLKVWRTHGDQVGDGASGDDAAH